jgi:hypothetical protein
MFSISRKGGGGVVGGWGGGVDPIFTFLEHTFHTGQKDCLYENDSQLANRDANCKYFIFIFLSQLHHAIFGIRSYFFLYEANHIQELKPNS